MKQNDSNNRTDFFTEIGFALRRNGFDSPPPTDGFMPVFLDGLPLCRITDSGAVRYRESDLGKEWIKHASDTIRKRTSAFYGRGSSLCRPHPRAARSRDRSHKDRRAARRKRRSLSPAAGFSRGTYHPCRHRTVAAAFFGAKIDKGIAENRLVTGRVYGHVRNPIYSAFLFLCTGALLIAGNLWLFVLPVAYWLFLTLLMKATEEKWLLRQYGQVYRDYCRRVPRCIPRLKKHRRRKNRP